MTKSKSRPRPGTRPAPERTCVVCRAKRAKAELVRVACVAGGAVEVDELGKGPGRGAYVCRRIECWETKHRNRRLEAALKCRLTDADAALLDRWAGSNLAQAAEPNQSSSDDSQNTQDRSIK